MNSALAVLKVAFLAAIWRSLWKSGSLANQPSLMLSSRSSRKTYIKVGEATCVRLLQTRYLLGEVQLRDAQIRLATIGRLSAVSPVYETEPVEFTAQPWFLNCAVAIETASNAFAPSFDLLDVPSSSISVRSISP